MSIRFRPYDPNRRFVWPLGRSAGIGRARWLALHRRPPDWGGLFLRALDLMLIDATRESSDLDLAGRSGRITWRSGRRWSIIDLDMVPMKEAKRIVVLTALLKAARYSR
jgi:hypothetical protein